MPEGQDKPDAPLTDIATYVLDGAPPSREARDTAHLALMDFLGCAFAALDEPECVRLIAPIVPETVVPGGARVPGTRYALDPAAAAFGIGTLGRWLDYNDSWFGSGGGGHPSDMFGAILATADHLARRARRNGGRPVTMAEVLDSAIKAYEIMGLHLVDNAFGGYDFTGSLKAACAAVVTAMLGGDVPQVVDAVSQGWVDGQPLRIVRSPSTGPRKNWASPDAAARAVWLAFKTMAGEPGYPTVLTTPEFGFYDVQNGGRPFRYPGPYGCRVMETIQFKVYPAQFRAQTALEATIALHPAAKERLDDIERIEIATHARTIRTIDKTGPLRGPADRDHCLQYIVAVGLVFGELAYRHYRDDVAADPRIDALREKMVVREDPDYTAGYTDPDVGTDANAIQVFFRDGTATDRIEMLYPLGDPRRRNEALPVLARKFRDNLAGRLPAAKEQALLALYDDRTRLAEMAVDAFMDLTVPDPDARQ